MALPVRSLRQSGHRLDACVRCYVAGCASRAAARAPIQSQYPRMVSVVRQRIGVVLRWAVAHGFRADNPAAAEVLSGVLRSPPAATAYRALPHAEVAGALARVRACDAWIGTRLLLEFQVLTAVCPGEARGALWSEFDLGAATWSIPADRMRQRLDHDVPLSSRALTLLEEARASDALRAARARGGCPDRVFPSPRGGRLYNHALSHVLSRLGFAAVPYGFRRSFREWCVETGLKLAVVETCLANRVVANPIVARSLGSALRRSRTDSAARFASGALRPASSSPSSRHASRIAWSRTLTSPVTSARRSTTPALS